MKKIFSLIILAMLLLTIAASAEEYTYSTSELGVVTIDVDHLSWFDKLFSTSEPLTIVTSNDAGKETANFAPGEKVNVKLGIEYGECNPKEALFYLRKFGNYDKPIIQLDLSKDKNILNTGAGCGFSVEVRTSFTAPNDEGKYEVSYVVKDNTGKIVKKEPKEILIQKTITTCPQNKCTDFKFLSPAGEGQVDSRECYTYTAAPTCTEKRTTEYRTTCEDGAVIAGTHDKISNKATSTCVSAAAPSSCVPLDESCNNKDDDCDNFVDEGLNCNEPTPTTTGSGAISDQGGFGSSGSSFSIVSFAAEHSTIIGLLMLLVSVGLLYGLQSPWASIAVAVIGGLVILGGAFLW